MAKRRKTAARKPARQAVKPGKVAKHRSYSPKDNATALVILAAIILVFAGIYFYQKKAKAAQLDIIPAIVSVEAHAAAVA